MSRPARDAAAKTRPSKSHASKGNVVKAGPPSEERAAGPPQWCDRPPKKNRVMLYVSIALVAVWFGWLIWLAAKVL